MSTKQVRFPFEDSALPLEERVSDLVSRLTLDEKIELMVQYQPAVERLGIKPYKHGTEAAHGVAWLGEATAFPQTIGLGCTWNKELMGKIGSVIGDEARIYYDRNPEVNGLTLWAPTVDMERDPRWGRTEEAYGEDPKLTGELTSAFVRGIQGDHPRYYKATATLKHFIGNNNEVNRGTCSASIDPRNMKEYYQAAFKPAIVKGGAQSIMTSYNSVNGVPMIIHSDVQQVVKDEWGMDGFIVSDAGDLIGLVNDHHYFETYTEAVAYSIKAGIDSITDQRESICPAIREALSEGLLEERDLDKALGNTFRVRFRLGEFDSDEMNPYASIPADRLCSAEHSALALRAAKESVVLLKNDAAALPIDRNKTSSVAVIGPLADVIYRDWYSGAFPYKVTPLEGIRRKLEGKAVSYCSANDLVKLRAVVNGKGLSVNENDEGRIYAGSEAGREEIYELTDWGWNSLTLRSVKTGKMLSVADDVHLAATADEAFGWFVKEVFSFEEQRERQFAIRAWDGRWIMAPNDGEASLHIASKEIQLGEEALFTMETVASGITEAAEAARSADTAIVVVGNNTMINGKEDKDRSGLELPAPQVQLIREVVAANPNTVVVVVGGYPFAMSEVQELAPAIVYTAHGCQELGNAIAEVLFGDYSPAGRLNMTWYKSESQLTDIMDYDIIRGKRTYMYFEDEPLYPFGHGLSYSSFAYSDLALHNRIKGGKGAVLAELKVTNTGGIAADEVVQLYVRAESSRVKRPLKQLIGFERIRLEPGETKTVQLSAAADEFELWDVTRDRFCFEAGTYTFMIGASSADIRLMETVVLEGETIPPRNLSETALAVNYDDCASIYLDEIKGGGTCIRLNGETGWISFADVAWSSTPALLNVSVCGGEEGGELIVRSAAADGAVIGRLVVAASPDSNWESQACELAAVSAETLELFIELKGSVMLHTIKVD